MDQEFSRAGVREELDSLERDITSLKAQMSESATNSDDERMLANLERRKSQLEEAWNDIKAKSEDAWEEMKESFKSGVDDIKTSFNYLKSRYF